MNDKKDNFARTMALVLLVLLFTVVGLGIVVNNNKQFEMNELKQKYFGEGLADGCEMGCILAVRAYTDYPVENQSVFDYPYTQYCFDLCDESEERDLDDVFYKYRGLSKK